MNGSYDIAPPINRELENVTTTKNHSAMNKNKPLG